MEPLFQKDKIIENAVSPYTSYCVGYPGQGGYFISFSLSIGIFPKTFSYYGSQVLDMILAYDKAEIEEGPTYLYSAAAIGIPQDRNNAACLLMEDVGKIESILAVGRNQNVEYKEIFIDFTHKKIGVGEIGCAWVFMPYFHLAQGAVTKNLANQSIDEWEKESQKHFLKV